MEIINLDYTFNTRDLCDIKTTDGLYIKKNRLIRSGSLHKLSAKDIETLKNKELKVVVDFRNEEEFVSRPDIRIDNVTYINAPAFSKYVVAKKENMDVDVYKIPHHGRYNNLSLDLIKKVTPEYAISTGDTDSEITNFLNANSIKYYNTEENTIHFSTNGTKLKVLN